MPISYPDILDIKSEPQTREWTDRDSMLYALGIGMGQDPMNEAELPFVYESGLKGVPTMATCMAWGGGPSPGAMGINFMLVVHGEQKVEIHKPLPTEATVVTDGRVLGAFDKGAGKGAVVVVETTMRQSGWSRWNAATSGTALSTSPTDTACSQSVGAVPAASAVGRRPRRSRQRCRYLP